MSANPEELLQNAPVVPELGHGVKRAQYVAVAECVCGEKFYAWTLPKVRRLIREHMDVLHNEGRGYRPTPGTGDRTPPQGGSSVKPPQQR